MAVDIGEFLLSDESSERLKQYQKESKEASAQNSWFEFLDHELFATNNCLKDLMVLAKKDLDDSHLSGVKKLLFQLQTYYKQK